MSCGGPLGERRPIITVTGLQEALAKLMEQHPDIADWPVHLLNVEPEDEDNDDTGLLNQVETDKFSETGPNVVSLVSGGEFHWRQCAKPILGSWENRMCCQRHAGHEGDCAYRDHPIQHGVD